VKGINFENIIDAGDPVELSEYYSKESADELVFLDITATDEKRKTLVSLVREIAKVINIPFTVGGGIRNISDIDNLLSNGADKISLNSIAIKNPDIISESSKRFGKQCIVVAIDAKYYNNEWWVYSNGGKMPTSLKLFSWAKQVELLGAGEILFTSINNDGTKDGYAIEALKELVKHVNIPVIASGGAGKYEHFRDVFMYSNVDAALAASIFHFGIIKIDELKKYLLRNNINVRI